MEEIFIKEIQINQVRHLKDIKIALSDTERKHLILTGKNGSGKTSVLEYLKTVLLIAEQNLFTSRNSNLIQTYESHIGSLKSSIKGQAQHYDPYWGAYNFSELNISNFQRQQKILEYELEIIKKIYSNQMLDLEVSLNNGRNISNFRVPNFINVFFDAKRTMVLNKPDSIAPDSSFSNYRGGIKQKMLPSFMSYLLSLKAERAFALEDNDIQKLQNIDNWFSNFEGIIQNIFRDKDLKLKFTRNGGYSFKLESKNREFDLTALSDGYSAFLSIVLEILFRVDVLKTDLNNIQGIVLIDEIETHLHIDLQKNILPFLTTFFPKIQFIVTTHSPFVLNSVNNAVVFDLETQQRVEDLSGYSYSAIVESYFDNDQYSEKLKKDVYEYETLMEKSNLSEEEEDRKLRLKMYFRELPKTLAPELSLRINQLELAALAK